MGSEIYELFQSNGAWEALWSVLFATIIVLLISSKKSLSNVNIFIAITLLSLAVDIMLIRVEGQPLLGYSLICLPVWILLAACIYYTGLRKKIFPVRVEKVRKTVLILASFLMLHIGITYLLLLYPPACCPSAIAASGLGSGNIPPINRLFDTWNGSCDRRCIGNGQ